MLTTSLAVQLVSSRSSWLEARQRSLEEGSRGRVRCWAGPAVRDGDWDAVIFDAEADLEEVLKATRDRLSWCALLCLANSWSPERRLAMLRAGASEVLEENASLFEAARYAVERARAQRSHLLSRGVLYQTQKLEAIGRMATGVAHDFKHLLQVILAACSLLKRLRDQDGELRENLDSIQASGLAACRLVERLLSFAASRPSAPRMVDIRAIVQGCQAILEPLAKSRIRMRFRVDDSLLFRADVTAVEQILINLVLNAVDAVPEGGDIWIETFREVLPYGWTDPEARLAPGVYAVLAVSDSGCGMDETTRTRLFEPFYSTKGERGGTGLGLASVSSCVQSLGGAIFHESLPGVGTTFKVFVPLQETLEHRSGPGARILLIEPDADRRLCKRQMLESAGHLLAEARSLEEAARQFAGESFDRLIVPAAPDATLPAPFDQVPVTPASGFSESLLAHLGWLRPDQKVWSLPGMPALADSP